MNIQNGIKYARTGLVALAMTVPAKSSKIIAHDVPIVKNTEYVANIKEKLLYDNPSYEPYLNMIHMVSNDIKSAKFNKSLNINKKSLKKDLNISEAQYNTYRKAIDRIGQKERDVNEIWESGSSQKNALAPEPLLMYRFNMNRPSKNELSLMKKYNIEYPKYDATPEQTAIRTVIHLAEIEKSYPKYVDIMKEVLPDTSKLEVKASINNAKRIMSNKTLAELAITEIEAEHLGMSFIDGKTANPLSGILSRKDVDDLKLLAKTLILPKEDFLVEMWDRHPIIPAGKNENRACANLLHLELNKY